MANMSIPVTQALLTRHANRFALDRIHVISYTEVGLEIGIVHPDESKERLEIKFGDTVELGGEKWRVMNIIPGVEIPAKGEVSSAQPRAIAVLQTNL
jgi:hypothetical protein